MLTCDLLLSSCFEEVTDPSSSRWHTGKGLFLVCVENSIKLDSAGCTESPESTCIDLTKLEF